MRLHLSLALSLLAAPLAPAAASAAKADQRRALLDAMAAELGRSRAELRIDDQPPPYYIGYRLVDARSIVVEARFGALVQDDDRHERKVAVDVRVGDYRFDSSPTDDELSFVELTGFRPTKTAPLDDDPAALRAMLWLQTDQQYKQALSTYLRKQARKVTRVEKDIPSFSRVEPAQHVDPPQQLSVDRDAWRAAARALSAKFRGDKHLLDGTVRFSAEQRRVFLVTTEGTRLIREHVLYSVAFEGVARAPDGLLLEQGQTLYGKTPDELPDAKALGAMVDQSIADLKALQAAPVADPYTGPAILEPEATGVFFHETVGHRLEGERQKDDEEGQTFSGQLGQRILPPFITVRDDPTQAAHAGLSLNGHYAFDDQGVPAQNVVLVRSGVLETFLTSRTPIEGVGQSNGHGRAQGTHRPVARMGNLIVEGAKPVPRAELKKMLIAEAKRQGKPYGLIIRDITGGSTNTSNYGYQAFKGTPRMVYRVDAETGAETLVRGVEMVGTPLTAVGKILATSDEMGVFNGFCGAESGYVPVSTVAPATLFREIELQRSQREKEKAPVLHPPWAAGKGGR
ncbi:MAG: TldD/PmbA family protein [Myxococcales bacterium]|nr:TldD/PmbA family protein [Myxococcales bacterium]MCB9538667.1 TldD/PmbA family protein [Myxococcales bacterium]